MNSFPNFILSLRSCGYICDHKSSNVFSTTNCQIRNAPCGESRSSQAGLWALSPEEHRCLLRLVRQSSLRLLKILYFMENPWSVVLVELAWFKSGTQSNKQRACLGSHNLCTPENQALGCILSESGVRSIEQLLCYNRLGMGTKFGEC